MTVLPNKFQQDKTLSVMWKLLRRQWRSFVWIVLLSLIVINCLVFIDISRMKTDKSANSERRNLDGSHLQIFRKRLNKSSPNSSSLHYVDWDQKDGATDIDAARHWINQEKESVKDGDNEEEEPDTDTYNQQNVVPEQNIKISDKHFQAIDRQDVKGNHPTEIQNDGVDIAANTGRGNYSIPEVDNFVEKFRIKYQHSKYAVDNKNKYYELLKRLLSLRQRGRRLSFYANKEGTWPWEKFHFGIHQYFLYDPEDASILKMLNDFMTNEVISIEQKEGGTQIKLIFTYENGGQVLYKPMRYGRDQETLPDHFYFADYERHNAEIAAFHLDGILGFHRVPPTVGRLMNVSAEIKSVVDSKLGKTFFISPAGNMCFHGSCSYYCDSSHPICGHPMMLEGSLAAFLPPLHVATRKTWRNPWKRSYSKHRKAYWETYDDLCEKVKETHPYNEGRRLLDVLDMSVFDFLTGNLDRHHYETFRDFGNDTFLLHLDNGRAFGKPKYDCMSCLAPVRQCCMIRLSTITKLVKFYMGPDSLSHVMRSSLKSDALNPILLEPHLDALDRRVSKILQVINGCFLNGMSWDEVIIDDGVT